jgi:choline dehydrogenase-like flavoprotein
VIIYPRLLDKQTIRTSICIIGSGAAGITLACELDGEPYDVLVLEAGGERTNDESSADYAGTANAPHPEPSLYRRIAFGGTTGLWGGRCVPFDPIDFQKRDYVTNSGWPISYDEVARFYPRAMNYCDAGAFDFSVGNSLANKDPTIPGLQDGVVLADRIERYSLPTDFSKRYRHKLEKSQNVRVLLESRCVALVKAPGEDKIEAIEIVDTGGVRRRVEANTFVLATGGIETPRLLLASDKEGTGLGNRTDRVGRFYGCHFENLCARIVSNGAKIPFQFERTREGVYSRRKLQFSAAAQKQHRLLNCAFRLHFPDYSDATHGSAVMSMIFLAKSTLAPEYRGILHNNLQLPTPSPTSAHVRNVALGLPQLAKFAYQWLFLRVLATRKLPYTLVPNADGSFPLEFNSEQTPLEHSRVTLSSDVDRHGLNRVHVDWRMSPDDIMAAERAFLVLRETINSSSQVRLELDPEGLHERLLASNPVGGHHIGTTRMGSSSREGVVDANCAVFDLPNLYIASSAVFPTNSHANPTLTIVAMALRLSEHLKRRTATAAV